MEPPRSYFISNDVYHVGNWENDRKDRSRTAENMAAETKWTQVKDSDPSVKTAYVAYDGKRGYDIRITSNRGQRTFLVEVNSEVVAKKSKDLRNAKKCAMHSILEKIHGKIGGAKPVPEPEPEPEKKSVAGQIEGILEDYVSTKIGILEQKVSDLQESVKDQTHRIVIECKPGVKPKVKEIKGMVHKDY